MPNPDEPCWIGIDFSGDARKWTSGCGQSNVWIAELGQGDELPVLQRLFPVQELPGSDKPFTRLIGYLKTTPARVVAIDAPFSLPRAYLPNNGWRDLLSKVASLDHHGRPFPRGSQLVDLVRPWATLEGAKPYRDTEKRWLKERINVRSTLWNGHRGGAPFTAACLKLLAATDLPCWPWSRSGKPLLVEAFPAAQLKSWGLKHAAYDKGNAHVREEIWCGLGRKLNSSDVLAQKALASADALDAVVCALTACAVDQGFVALPAHGVDDEGWIAVQQS